MKDTFWVEEYSEKPPVCHKRKRRVGKRKIEFVGWGSRPLIEFLEAIGKNTRENHSRHEVAAFITKYINDKGLASAEKKKKVLCDERLYALFGKKSFSRIKVYDLLEEHFAENHDDDDSDDEESSDDGERNSLGPKKNPPVLMKKVPKIPKSCFAAIIPENIKLIYLKKSLVQELLKSPESFEFKIVGSFVRMKCDPNDISQKNPFQLQQVTGVEKVSGAVDAGKEILLKVSNFFRSISIGMLSDDNFSEEELEDVRDRIKAGSLNRLIVKELQLKTQVLHVDITKHWIAKEVPLLQRLIEHANEKGWQRQKFEYIERRKRLQTPSEVEKLMLMIPEVIAEELEPEAMEAEDSGKAEVNVFSPNSILRGSSDVSSTDASGSGDIVAPTQVIFSDPHDLKVQTGGVDDPVPIYNPKGSGGIMAPSRFFSSDSHALKVENGSIGIIPDGDPKGDRPASNLELGTLVVSMVSDGSSREMQAGVKDTDPNKKAEKPVLVIDLSDSEDEGPKTEVGIPGESPNDRIWYYLDPRGQTQGPFSLFMLKQWSDANYFHPGFTIWKEGQTIFDRVLLVDVLRLNFPN